MSAGATYCHDNHGNRKAGVRYNVEAGEMPTNVMMAVSRGREEASVKGP